MTDEEQEAINRKLYKRAFNSLIWMFQISIQREKLKEMYGIQLADDIIEILEMREKMGSY